MWLLWGSPSLAVLWPLARCPFAMGWVWAKVLSWGFAVAIPLDLMDSTFLLTIGVMGMQ